ncbi:ATP-binding protein [Shewanella baltica]|uniref:hypothetical protein n=1 Tax=Shewanella baltica TaxID=62322 RepID=UPI00217D3469|nr:hypothetical protein [Shewanella baltica]MCS6133850.1 ATP-binding protein [Shewanella baltica]
MNKIRAQAELLNGQVYFENEYLGSCVPFATDVEGQYFAITCAHVIYGNDDSRVIDNFESIKVITKNGRFKLISRLTNELNEKEYDIFVMEIIPVDEIDDSALVRLSICEDINESLLSHEHALIVSPVNDNAVSCVPIKSFNRNVNEYSYEAEVDKATFYDIDRGVSGAKAFKGVSGSGLFVIIDEYICLAGILSKIPKSIVTTPIILQKGQSLIKFLLPLSNVKVFKLDKSINVTSKAELKYICFTNYTLKSKYFYHLRPCDKEFNFHMNNYLNIWVHGLSGSGKTALLMYNLIQSDVEYIYCDLQPITISSENDIWQGVIDDILFRHNISFNSDKIEIKSLCQFLLKCKFENNVAIVIDEMSCNDESVINDFCNTVTNLVGYYNKLSGDKNIIFIISSIFSPYQQKFNKLKFFELFETVCSNEWSGELTKLFDIQNLALGNKICNKSKSFIINNCNNSPRLLTQTVASIYRRETFSFEIISSISNKLTEEYNTYD